jgi:hypothetical protein
MTMKQLFFFLVFCFACCAAQAQRRDYNYKFIARLIDADTAVFIPNCHIINKTQNLGTISDVNGSFSITANIGDSIIFRNVGYERFVIAVSDSMYSNDRIIRLVPAIYEIPEVRIGLLSTYERFKRDFLSMEAQEAIRMAPLVNQNSVYTPPLPNQGGINIPLGNLSHPVSLLYDLLSKEGKQRSYYLSIVNGTAEHIKIGAKFNGYIVKKLTGLENDELVKFMSYCNFSNDYLLAASEKQIERDILRKFREYTVINS